MDPKKQELNPEIKEIYERVMNTQVRPPASSQPAAPQSEPPPPPQPAQSIENKPFVFTGNKVVTPQDTASPGAQESASRKIPGPVIAILVLILIIAWAFFWAKFFGLI